MKFSYTATTSSGKTVSGTTDAVDKDTVISSLRKQGLKPVIVKMASDSGKGMKKRGGKVKNKDLVVFTRQLSTMISAGVPLPRSLATMQDQSENKYFKSVIGGITKDVESGLSLGEAFEKYPNVFSDVYINMVKAGEAGGILDEILKRLAEQVEQDASMRKKVKSAMMYPTVIFSITIIAFFGIMMFVIPKIGKIIKDLGGPDAELPVYTQAMLGLSDFMQNNAIIIFVLLFGGAFLIRRYIKTPKGKYKFHALLLRIPIVKTIVIKIAIARFARTFASLMSAGVGVLDALEVTGGAIGNKVIEDELKDAAKAVKNGKQLSEPLSNSKYFPQIVSQMLTVGEETGQIDTILVKVADFYEEEVQTTIDGLSSIIEPLMIVVLGGMVGIIAASVMGPISSLSKNVGN
ncbi:type II secretion system F family protein [Candidatus Saccharibacteria bacterium]|nr:type II secretion system F family protein [Candidatus Saccharibacteria bacterium]